MVGRVGSRVIIHFDNSKGGHKDLMEFLIVHYYSFKFGHVLGQVLNNCKKLNDDLKQIGS